MEPSPVINPVDWLPLVRKIARQMGAFRRPETDVGAAIGAGTVALVRCAKGWDGAHESGASFMSYAFRSVRCAILQELRSQANWRHLRAPHAQKFDGPAVILFSEFGDDMARGRTDDFACTDDDAGRALDEEDARAEAADLLRFLDKRYRKVVALRFGLDGAEAHDYRAICEQLGFTRERARQIVAESLLKMRQAKEKA